MKIIKRINNNAVLCVDKNGCQIVALGRGLSTLPLSSELDLTLVEHTFYNVDPRYVDMLKDVPPEYLSVSAAVADTARSLLSYELSPNVDVALADHLAFAVQRMQEHMFVSTPLVYDIQQNYPLEYKIAQYALRLLKEKTGYDLPQSEAPAIAMCFINNAYNKTIVAANSYPTHEEMLETITGIIEETMGIEVDREGFAFARFATHVQYLLQRVESHDAIDTDNSGMYAAVAEDNPEISACVDLISVLIDNTYGHSLTQEEKLYLILHTNRICVRSEPEGT